MSKIIFFIVETLIIFFFILIYFFLSFLWMHRKFVYFNNVEVKYSIIFSISLSEWFYRINDTVYKMLYVYFENFDFLSSVSYFICSLIFKFFILGILLGFCLIFLCFSQVLFRWISWLFSKLRDSIIGKVMVKFLTFSLIGFFEISMKGYGQILLIVKFFYKCIIVKWRAKFLVLLEPIVLSFVNSLNRDIRFYFFMERLTLLSAEVIKFLMVDCLPHFREDSFVFIQLTTLKNTNFCFIERLQVFNNLIQKKIHFRNFFVLIKRCCFIFWLFFKIIKIRHIDFVIVSLRLNFNTSGRFVVNQKDLTIWFESFNDLKNLLNKFFNLVMIFRFISVFFKYIWLHRYIFFDAVMYTCLPLDDYYKFCQKKSMSLFWADHEPITQKRKNKLFNIFLAEAFAKKCRFALIKFYIFEIWKYFLLVLGVVLLPFLPFGLVFIIIYKLVSMFWIMVYRIFYGLPLYFYMLLQVFYIQNKIIKKEVVSLQKNSNRKFKIQKWVVFVLNWSKKVREFVIFYFIKFCNFSLPSLLYFQFLIEIFYFFLIIYFFFFFMIFVIIKKIVMHFF